VHLFFYTDNKLLRSGLDSSSSSSAAVLERDEGVEPRARGPPTPTATLLAAATRPKACSVLCFVKEDKKVLAKELADPVSPVLALLLRDPSLTDFLFPSTRPDRDDLAE